MIAPPGLGAAAAGAFRGAAAALPTRSVVRERDDDARSRGREYLRALGTVVTRTCILFAPRARPCAQSTTGYSPVSVPSVGRSVPSRCVDGTSAGHAELRDPPRRARVAARRRSGGPGGQHANTSDTRVEVRFDRRRRRRSGRANGRGCSSGSARWCGPPRPTPARRRGTASSRWSGSASRLAEGCGSNAAAGHQAHEAASGRRLDAKRRQSARKRDRRPPRPDHELARVCEADRRARRRRGPVVRGGHLPARARVRLGGPHVRAAPRRGRRSRHGGVRRPARGVQPAGPPDRTYEGRDRVMALYAPVGLLVLPFVWLRVVLARSPRCSTPSECGASSARSR